MCKMSLNVTVNKYEIINERQKIHIIQNLMDNLPSSKYHKDWDIYILTDEGFESDTTMVYWPLMDESGLEHVESDSPIPSTSRISKHKPTFNINWHGIRHRSQGIGSNVKWIHVTVLFPQCMGGISTIVMFIRV